MSNDGDKWIESLRKAVAGMDNVNLDELTGPERRYVENTRACLARYDREEARARANRAPPAEEPDNGGT